MITLVRLEADGKDLTEVLASLDATAKGLKLPKEMTIHDEHYERVHKTCYKGRRVFRLGEKGVGTVPPNTAATSTAGSTVWMTPRA